MLSRTLLGISASLAVTMTLIAFACENAWAGRVPPKVSYHYGEKQYLERNARIDEVPEEDWRKFVMGEGQPTTYGLPLVRRGLYTGTDLSSISHYTPNCGSGRTPWIKAIHLKESCRDPKVVGDLSDLQNDERFKKWFDERLNKEELAKKLLSSPVLKPATPWCLDSFDKFAQSAFQADGKPRIRYHKYHKIQGENENTEIHEEVINEWIKFNDFKVMLNDNTHEQPSQQWYIRDRSCIEKIDGSPEEVLRMVADRKDFFFSFRQVRDGWKKKIVDDYDSTAAIFLRALAEAKEIDPKLLQSLKANINDPKNRMPDPKNKQGSRPGDPEQEDWRPAFQRILESVGKCGGTKAYRTALSAAANKYDNECTFQDFKQVADKVEEACK